MLQFLKEDIQKKATEGGHKFEFDYDKNPGYEKGNCFGKDLWYTTALFASPSKLLLYTYFEYAYSTRDL